MSAFFVTEYFVASSGAGAPPPTSKPFFFRQFVLNRALIAFIVLGCLA